MDEVVSQMCLHARVIESAVHRPGEWTLLCDDTRMGVHVETLCLNDGTVEAKFVSGPMPSGTHYLTLECSGTPMFSGEFEFDDGRWWVYRVASANR